MAHSFAIASRYGPHEPFVCILMTRLLWYPNFFTIRLSFSSMARGGTQSPRTTRDISAIGSYCIIWSPEDLPQLSAKLTAHGDWYCRDENSTIQFLRCKLTETVIAEGSFAISTEPAEAKAAANVERRYKLLSRAIKKPSGTRSFSSGIRSCRKHRPDHPGPQTQVRSTDRYGWTSGDDVDGWPR
ncbi:conserved hypothetical protein [Mesorhizobium escarrei]|uniref:Uncharacterized protein n=1 Tax=Mesorhizobium escarrei TaxID=666018 RepID=A0ABM9E0L2_9HYPH|nr:conserved hypothetical protein [Mesorhizobium escarrei]